MKKKLAAISLTLGTLLFCNGARADSWGITQTVTPGSNTTVSQGYTSISAIQALNAVNVDTVTATGQTVTMGESTLTLSQGGPTTATSVQAANYINAATAITSFAQDLTSSAAASALTLGQSADGNTNTQAVNYALSPTITSLDQTVTTSGAAGDIALTQTIAAGSNSVQAVNVGIGSTTIADLDQEINASSAGDLTLTQDGAAAGNDQAGNYAWGASFTTLIQHADDVVDLSLVQSAGDTNEQAVNYAKATTSVGGTLTQSVATAGITLDQSATGMGNLQAVNAVDAAAVLAAAGSVGQSATTSGSGITLDQSAGTNAFQTVNYLTSVGTVHLVNQNYLNAGQTATLTQDGTNASYQALNTIEMTGGSNLLTTGTQTVTLSELIMEQGTTVANTGSSQAANLLLSEENIATATQTVTADIALTQQNGGTSTQAVNLASAKDITTKLTQTVTGSDDTFIQNTEATATGSIQAGNFLDVAATGTITSVEQNYNATSATLTQEDRTTSIQGLNVIDASAATAALTLADQNVVMPVLTMIQGVSPGTSGSLQAGNAVLTATGATGGTVTQDVTVTTLAMSQNYNTKSIQAANFVGTLIAL